LNPATLSFACIQLDSTLHLARLGPVVYCFLPWPLFPSVMPRFRLSHFHLRLLPTIFLSDFPPPSGYCPFEFSTLCLLFHRVALVRVRASPSVRPFPAPNAHLPSHSCKLVLSPQTPYVFFVPPVFVRCPIRASSPRYHNTNTITVSDVCYFVTLDTGSPPYAQLLYMTLTACTSSFSLSRALSQGFLCVVLTLFWTELYTFVSDIRAPGLILLSPHSS